MSPPAYDPEETVAYHDDIDQVLSPGKQLLCGEPLASSPSKQTHKRLSVALIIKWTSGTSGKSRQNSLSLRRIAEAAELQGLPRDLMARAFPPGSTPRHLTSCAREYYHFTPDQEALSLPSDVSHTLLRLVVSYDGWEYVVYERPLRTQAAAAAAAQGGEQGGEAMPLLVTVVEFESTAMVIGALGVRVQLVAYPVVSVRKDFLDDVDFRLRSDPDSFKGILS